MPEARWTLRTPRPAEVASSLLRPPRPRCRLRRPLQNPSVGLFSQNLAQMVLPAGLQGLNVNLEEVFLPTGLQSPGVGFFNLGLEKIRWPAGLRAPSVGFYQCVEQMSLPEGFPACREHWKDALHAPARASGSGGLVGLAAEVASSLLRPPKPRRRLLRPLQSPSVGLFN